MQPIIKPLSELLAMKDHAEEKNRSVTLRRTKGNQTELIVITPSGAVSHHTVINNQLFSLQSLTIRETQGIYKQGGWVVV